MLGQASTKVVLSVVKGRLIPLLVWYDPIARFVLNDRYALSSFKWQSYTILGGRPH